MSALLVIPLVNWGMGAIIIGVFAVVCIIMAAVVYSMANAEKKKDETDSSITE